MKKVLFILSGLFLGLGANAQNERPITTGVPFLLIAADARAAGMGDNGVATSPDAFSQQYNPAKYAFSLQKQGFSVSYTPYLTSIANFLLIEKNIGRDVHILYSREITEEEYNSFHNF